MTDSKMLQDIAEKAGLFARANAVDRSEMARPYGAIRNGEVVEDDRKNVATILKDHDRLSADPNFVLHLHTSRVAALSFFEGYLRAVQDLSIPDAAKDSEDLVESVAIAWFGARSEITQAAARTHRDHAKRVILFLSGRIGQMTVSGKPFVEHLRDLLGAKPHEGVVAAIERLQRERDEMRAKIDSQTDNIGIVKKPPPPPPPPAAPSIETISDASRDRISLPNRIVFRDERECGYWDEMTLILASKRDTTSQSVASAADEMVEERRARMPLVKLVCDALWTPEGNAPGYDAFPILKENRVRVRIATATEWKDFYLDDDRFQGKNPDLIVAAIRTELRSRESIETKQEPVNEVTDELLLEAAAWANEFCEMKASEGDLAAARSVMNGNVVHEVRWSNAIRSYVNGAIRKARKP